MKFLHSADWQMGARFAQFGECAGNLRQARLTTLRRALEAARQREAEAFIIAGDLFEHNQVDDSVVGACMDIFGAFPDVPLLILPGNHDPHTGPGSVWSRRRFGDLPGHITVFREPQKLEVNGSFFLASPLQQKVSTVDPSLKLRELAEDLPLDSMRIGITHGALAIPGKHQRNDFPIDLAAATRAGLDYLAVGHWHEWQVYDNNRLIMPGTPEPDSFDQTDSGCVAFVEITHRGAVPRVERLPVATMSWRTLELDALEGDAGRQVLAERLAALRPQAATSVLRLRLRGAVSPQTLSETRAWLMPRLEPFPTCQLVDHTTMSLSEVEWRHLQATHPILAEVLADLDQMATFFAGTPAGAAPGEHAIALPDAQHLLAAAKIDPTSLLPAHFNLARQLLLQKLQEVGS